jgi:hypothetical protein
MRLPEATIKQAIILPEKLVRSEALRYFTDCFSRDREVMPQAIKAIRTFGRRDAFWSLNDLANLAQTEATVDWGIHELHRETHRAEDPASYFPALSEVLCHAELSLVVARADEIIRAPRFVADFVPDFQDRLLVASWDADQCWKELESISARAMVDQEPDVDFGHVGRVVEALARQGDKYVDRILNTLGRKIEDFEHDPMVWMEVFLVMLAGEMRLEPAIPLIAAKLHEVDGDFLLQESVTALAKIGTDAAAEAVTQDWLESDWDYHLFAADALQRIHSDTTVRKCLELLPQEKNREIKTYLADVLLGQFAAEAIEPVRELVDKRDYDPTISDLMGRLVAVSSVLGVTFPEYPIWKREAEKKRVQQERRMREFMSSAQEPERPGGPAPGPAHEPLESRQAPFVRGDKPVGRNDPCPCGSGKKFKKCCMNA